MPEIRVVDYDGLEIDAENRTVTATVVDGGVGPEGPAGEKGDPGDDGRSAYEVAQDNGFSGTELEWLDSLQGVDGDDGIDGSDGAPGKSAYELAQEEGFSGTQAEWLASLQGSDGEDGSAGASAYEIAVANGFVGNQAAWLASLVGDPGDDGDDGTDGRNPEFQKSATHIQWRLVGDSTWLDLVALVDLKGEQGDPGNPGTDGTDGNDGAPGDSAYDIAVANGFSGTEAQWLASLQGADGADGADGAPGTPGADGVVQSIVAGDNVTVDDTDPANPIISATGGGGGTSETQRESLTAAGGNDTLTLGATPLTGSVFVWVNGILLWPGIDYDITDEVVTFTDSLDASDAVWVSWQTTDPSPDASALSTAASGGFTPVDISGLLAWYSADAETGYADGDQMTSWTDLSGNAHHATAAGATKPLWKASAGPASGPAVQFSASIGYFTLPNILASLTEAEIMLYVRSDAAVSSVNGFWSMSDQGGANDGNYYPHSGVVYTSFGLPSGHRQSFTPSVAITSWRRLDSWAKANDWATLLDETSQGTYTGASSTGFPATPWLGRTGANGSGAEAFRGWMSCVVIFDHKLTTQERADLAEWMTANPSGGTA